MGFVEAIKTVFSKYVDFEGRATRSEYWWWALFMLLLAVVMAVVVGETVANLVFLGLLLPSLGVGARRLHDIGKSGWWLLVNFIPLIGMILLIYWAVQPSEGDNAYGPVPTT
ncbi:DUF805 domain-containing protein [Hydrogenophaga pseudoflava]|uniref:DUF805 domain-containing protein n=1 Tax=Hydrogenophaga pseudoflava TaxID=47421 RepID=UPI0027E5B633|nr:DUF805 domain-containing protein [Hydrogenophaga pseudoflava]MDQ7743352.1 DUF805 domain-containing protein [Hydrogenophaga pseudoflava]